MVKELWISWKDLRIPVEVLYSARKTFGLEVTADLKVRARVPKRATDRQIREFAEERKVWIVEKYLLQMERAKKKQDRPAADYEKDPKLEKLYREKAREQIEKRAAHFAALMGVDYGRIAIRSQKRRWGSCSGAGNLNFNWKLALMPPEILDYVVVHELAHRKEMNHSPRFWAEVEKILPDYKERRKWLKENGAMV